MVHAKLTYGKQKEKKPKAKQEVEANVEVK